MEKSKMDDALVLPELRVQLIEEGHPASPCLYIYAYVYIYISISVSISMYTPLCLYLSITISVPIITNYDRCLKNTGD